MNDQRRVIFEQRIDLMNDEAVTETINAMRHEVIEAMVRKHIPEKVYAEQWDVAGLHDEVQAMLNIDVPVTAWAKEEGIADEEMRERLERAVDEAAAARTARFTPEIMRQVEKAVLLQTLDHLWRDHLVTLDHLRQVVGFRGYAQRDPLNEYKSEAFELFQGMLAKLREDVTSQIMRVELMQRPPPLAPEGDIERMEGRHVDSLTGDTDWESWGANGQPQTANAQGAAVLTATAAAGAAAQIDPNNPATWGKVQRNALCPCGSGKKYKHCHGAF
jgi:preprotein translocase subunit SecA